MKRRKRRGVSPGTVLVIVITAATLAASLRIIPRLAGDTTLRPDEAQKIADSLTGYLHLPELTLQDIPILSFSNTGSQPTDGTDNAGMPLFSEAVELPAQVTPEPTAAPPVISSFRILAAGTLTADKPILSSFYGQESDTYDFSPLFSYIQSDISADVCLFTLKNLMDNKQKYSNLNTSASLLSAVRDARFDVIALGHDKAMDLGLSSLKNTMATLRDEGFSVIGALSDPDDQSLLILDLDGAQVAFLHYTQAVSSQGKKTIKRDNAEFALPLLSAERIENDIAKARQSGANVVIVSLYWASGIKSVVNKTQSTLVQQIADAGADVILGASDDAMQPIVFLQSERPGGRTRQTLAVYSLGALVTSKRGDTNIISMLLHLDIRYDPSLDAVTFEQVSYSPLYIWRYREGKSDQYRPVLAHTDPPEGMSKEQIIVMERSFKRIQGILGDFEITIN